MATRNINLHPTNGYHASLNKQTSFDIIIIGAGPIAVFAKNRLSSAGLSNLVVIEPPAGSGEHAPGCGGAAAGAQRRSTVLAHRSSAG